MNEVKNIVVKIGTSSLTHEDGSLSEEKIKDFVRQIASLRDHGHNVAVVSSGSIAAGFRKIGYAKRPSVVARKQAAAAVGQGLLMEQYNKELESYGYVGAQILLTRGDFTDKRRYDNIFAATQELMRCGAVPIINENDTTSIEELKFGDNDTLSAQVASMIHADLLIILSDIDGLYTADPNEDPDAKRISLVEEITPDILSLGADTSDELATGGMHTKLTAASLATLSGVPVFLTSSKEFNAVLRSVDHTVPGTYFRAAGTHLKTRLQWVAFYNEECGRLLIDEGAVQALEKEGKSLLPGGVKMVEGSFTAGEIVGVYDANGKLIGRGVSDYSATELIALRGQSGGRHAVVIHRNNWVDGRMIRLFKGETR